MFDFGFAIEECFEEPEGFWFLFFTDGAGGLWADAEFHIGHRVDGLCTKSPHLTRLFVQVPILHKNRL